MSDEKHLYVVKGISREALVDIAYRAGEQDAIEHIKVVYEKYKDEEDFEERYLRFATPRYITADIWQAIKLTIKQVEGEDNDN